ncbi:MAG TPA: hypothetical protein VGC66_04570 [Pyrinomonadaceae bacterium]|jgi:hypothetical protein
MATDEASTSQDGFPAELEQVPLTGRVLEAFGWMPSLIGGALLGMAMYILFFAPPSAASSGMYGVIAGMAVGGILLLYYEVRRRLNRTVLVPREELIGIYRKRKFARHITVNEITPYKLSWSNTFTYLFIPVILTVSLLFVSIAPQTQQGAPSARLGALVGGLLMLAASVSLIRTRLLCRHFYIPKGKRSQEEILLTGAEASRVFSSTR